MERYLHGYLNPVSVNYSELDSGPPLYPLSYQLVASYFRDDLTQCLGEHAVTSGVTHASHGN